MSKVLTFPSAAQRYRPETVSTTGSEAEDPLCQSAVRSMRVGAGWKAAQQYLAAIRMRALSLTGREQMMSYVIGELMAWVCLKEGRPYSEVTNEVQKHLFKRILTETQGDLDQAAMRLGMKKDDLSYIVESRYPELTDKIARHLPAVLLLVAGVF